MYLINDFFHPAKGGGTAIIHRNGCARTSSLSRLRELYAGCDFTVSQYTYRSEGDPNDLSRASRERRYTRDDAIKTFRRKWTVPVDVEICECVK
ncbi:hypothetical protein [Saccharopolyspora griseoalba]|uniref:Uncharacterized protein n=1 Tax=Saccharopolyspora griseoalba TaxID=1431848 RepID=A0ABW2LQT5_9PSEU